MNLSLPRLAAVAGLLAALVTGMPAAFAHNGNTVAAASGSAMDVAYVPYLGGFGDPLGLTASNRVDLDIDLAEATGSIAEDADYIPYLNGAADPLGLTSSR
jgi:hypothetical protein